jgi:ATP-dependent Lon protease
VTIAVLPTRDAVLLPGAVTELRIGRPCSVAAIRHAMERDARVVVLLQKRPAIDSPRPDDLRSVGCVGEIISATRESAEAAAVSVVGLERVRVDQLSADLLAEVTPLGWDPPQPALPAHYGATLMGFIEGALRPQLNAEANARLRCSSVMERLAAVCALFLEAEAVQQTLETQDFTTTVAALLRAEKPTFFERIRTYFR